jgi:hypothetical protein
VEQTIRPTPSTVIVNKGNQRHWPRADWELEVLADTSARLDVVVRLLTDRLANGPADPDLALAVLGHGLADVDLMMVLATVLRVRADVRRVVRELTEPNAA